MKRIFTNQVESLYLNALVYGPAGVGKTMSSTTLPGKTVIIAAEPGLRTLAGYDIEAWTIESWDDFDQAINLLKSDADEVKDVDNIFVDSLTEVCKICVDHILDERVSILQARKTNMSKQFKDQKSMEDWGIAKGRIDRLCRGFRDLPYNVVLTALCSEQKNEITGVTTARPLVSPSSFANELPGLFDNVCYARSEGDAEEQAFWWEWVNCEKWVAKDRSGILPARTEQNWQIVFDAHVQRAKAISKQKGAAGKLQES